MFNKNARCINVGSNAEPTWFPADHLKIVEWQIVKKNLPEPYVAAMIDATKRPQQSKVAIKETALGELDFLEEDPFYKVRKISQILESHEFIVYPLTPFTNIRHLELHQSQIWLRSKREPSKLRHCYLVVGLIEF